MTTTIDVNEQQALAKLLELARSGHEVILAEGEVPIARLTAIAATAPPPTRVAGLHQGTATVSADFDQPLPDEFWLGGA